jgi:hypothetical protein
MDHVVNNPETAAAAPTPTPEPARPWRTAAHMLGFGLLLALIFFLAKGPPVDPTDVGRVLFTEADLAHVQAAFERTWGRPPSAAERRKAFDSYVRDEVLYREALARGLDRDDPLVKMSLVRKITLLGTVAAESAQPTDAEMKAYFDLRTDRYRVPASFDLFQVTLSRDKHGEQLESAANQRLAEFQARDPSPEELAGLSEIGLLPHEMKDASEDELARTFGTDFSRGVLSLGVGQWAGPVRSGFGLHLVKITRRDEPRIPDWSEVRDRLATDMQFEGRTAAEDQFYAEIRPRYHVDYSDKVKALLEADERRKASAP